MIIRIATHANNIYDEILEYVHTFTVSDTVLNLISYGLLTGFSVFALYQIKLHGPTALFVDLWKKIPKPDMFGWVFRGIEDLLPISNTSLSLRHARATNIFRQSTIFPPFTTCDAPIAWQIGFQDPATSIMEGIIELHNNIFFYLIVILILVFWMIIVIFLHYSYQFNSLFKKYDEYSILDNIRIEIQRRRFKAFYLIVKKNLLSQKITHNATLETIWVILPAIILVSIAIPSFDILYSMDEIFNPEFLIKVVGNQWYWSYEIPAYNLSPALSVNAVAFDALMVPQEDSIKNNILNGVFRLLDTDLWLCLPAKTHIQVILTSEDVIHSWAVPSLGAKIDCVPGRLNQISLYIKRAGIFYGQCSEICGINHGFMPIKISAFAIKTWLIKSVKLIEGLQGFTFSY